MNLTSRQLFALDHAPFTVPTLRAAFGTDDGARCVAASLLKKGLARCDAKVSTGGRRAVVYVLTPAGRYVRAQLEQQGDTGGIRTATA